MKKEQWAKSADGPDWTDLEITLRALDGLHGARTTVTVSPDGIGSSGGLLVDICTKFDVLPGGADPPMVHSVSRWPCKDCTTMEAHLLGGLYQHDFNISEVYMQQSLWRQPPDTGKEN